MKKYCRLASIPEHKSHHHVLKHSTCMNVLDGGAQINEVQKFAGHKSLNSTAQYLKVSDERACRAFAGVALKEVTSRFFAAKKAGREGTAD